mgnify:CR=1 FL=1
MKNNNKLLISIGIANAFVLYISSMLFPTNIVLGNNSLTPILAAVLTGFILSAVMALPEPTMKAIGLKTKNEMHLAFVYLVFNVVGLWVLGRIANYVGFGVSSFVVVFVLGFVLNFVQYFVWKMIAGGGKK